MSSFNTVLRNAHYPITLVDSTITAETLAVTVPCGPRERVVIVGILAGDIIGAGVVEMTVTGAALIARVLTPTGGNTEVTVPIATDADGQDIVVSLIGATNLTSGVLTVSYIVLPASGIS